MDNKEMNKFIGKRIKEERTKKNLTQRQLGDIVGVQHNTMSSYESGINAPEQNIIFLIAWALNIRVDDLFSESN